MMSHVKPRRLWSHWRTRTPVLCHHPIAACRPRMGSARRWMQGTDEPHSLFHKVERPVVLNQLSTARGGGCWPVREVGFRLTETNRKKCSGACRTGTTSTSCLAPESLGPDFGPTGPTPSVARDPGLIGPAGAMPNVHAIAGTA